MTLLDELAGPGAVPPPHRPHPAHRVGALPGPLLLSHLGDGPDAAAHPRLWGPLPRLDADALVALVTQAGISGRGGAGFPLARKLTTVLENRRIGRRPVVVVNAAEGEPASAKDSTLLQHAPHLVLDGAALAAAALGAREVHIVTAADRPAVGAAVDAALAERDDGRITWRRHRAAARFVSGQAQAVLELLAGRVGMPVTAWVPEAVRGVGGRPTLLSNAETLAQLAALVRVGGEHYARLGTPAEPGTTLLTVNPIVGDRLVAARPLVVEVGTGRLLADVLAELPPGGGGGHAASGVVLTGGFHGTWAGPERLAGLTLERAAFAARGLARGAGVIAPLYDACPVAVTASIADYLAGESAGRCGPCAHGLPALADALADLAAGVDSTARVAEVCGLVEGRGACAHPDGTARLAGSLLTHLPDAVSAHLAGDCRCGDGGSP